MTDAIDFVVPAHNEEATVAAVVEAIRNSRACRTVTVVADACTDATAFAAHAEGWAYVLEIDAGDKGSALAAGLEDVQTPRVGFIDADLVGLDPSHIDALAAAPFASMAVGTRDGTTRPASFLPPIGGERVLPTAVARSAGLEGAGYRTEMQLAAAAERAGIPIIEIHLAGVQHESSFNPQMWAGVATGYVGYLGARNA